MGDAISQWQMASDPRVCGIPGTISAVQSEQRRTNEALAKAERDSYMDNRELADVGHNRSSCNVLDSGRVRTAIGVFEGGEKGSGVCRIGIAGLVIWGVTATALALIMSAWIFDLKKDILRLTDEVKQAYNMPQ